MRKSRKNLGLATAIAASGLALGTLEGCKSAWQRYQDGDITYAEYEELKEKQSRFLESLLWGGLKQKAVERGDFGSAAGIDTIADLRAADMNRSKVNVYNAPERTSQNNHAIRTSEDNDPRKMKHNKYGEIFALTCNYAEDFNNNNILEYPKEFMGVKDFFRKGERISFYFSSSRHIKGLKYRIIDSSGKTLDELEPEKEFEKWGTPVRRGITAFYNLSKEEEEELSRKFRHSEGVSKLDEGAYRVLIYSGESLILMHDFEVLD